MKGLRGQQGGYPLGPLDGGNAVARQVLLDADIDRIIFATKSIQIKMIQWYRALVLVDEGKCRTVDGPGYMQAAGQPLDEAGLARPEVAMKRDHGTPGKGFRPFRRPSLGFLRAVAHDGRGAGHGGILTDRPDFPIPGKPRPVFFHALELFLVYIAGLTPYKSPHNNKGTNQRRAFMKAWKRYGKRR